MKSSQKSLFKELLNMIDVIIEEGKKLEKEYEHQLAAVHPKNQLSARNLLHYNAMRKFDLSGIQKKLRNLGLSRLANAESHTFSNLFMNKALLRALYKGTPVKVKRPDFSPKKAIRIQKRNSKDLLGYRSKGRRTRIMVTMPSDAGNNYTLVYQMVKSGMNCSRINCAHDNPEVWQMMIRHLRDASEKLQKTCKIAMDLAGPKIRTEQMIEGPRILKIRTTKDVRGVVKDGTKLWFGIEPSSDAKIYHIPVNPDHLSSLKNGDQLYLRDARDRMRNFKISEINENGCYAECFRTTYLETGMPIYMDAEMQNKQLEVGILHPVENFILLNVGDYLRLDKNSMPGENASYDDLGKMKEIAHISCSCPELFEQVAVDERVLFDDGKIESKVVEINAEYMILCITHAKEGGAKLMADKGINFPTSKITLSGLTEKDKQDLKFAVKHADVINMSFVNSVQDVKELIAELEKLGLQDKLGIILKIETQRGYNNLLEIILEAMRLYPVGLMIARGDLAVEVGWDNIARVQEEILSIAQSAHIPDIWATQVLENLAKKGIPSRAEISDTIMAQRSECIMLNKGPYIIDAIGLLNSILKDMKPYYDKRLPLSPAMQKLEHHA